MTISRWSKAQLQDGGWIRRMFMEGLRLRAQYGDDAVADLSIGQPLEAGDAIVDAFRAASEERFVGRFGYMPNLGYQDVRERAAEDVDVPGITADSIAMTSGAAAAICIALRTFVDPGDDVIGVAPYFPEFRLYCETASARFVPVRVDDDLRLDLDAIAAVLSPRTAAVLLNSPSNPSGHVLDAAELRGLTELLSAHSARHDRHVVLIVDEVYRRLIYAPYQRAEPQGGIYVWLRSPWPDTLALIDELARRRVLLTPGVAFGVPSHIRLCFSAPRKKLATALDTLAELASTPVSA